MERSRLWRWLAFLSGFLAVGVPYWLVPYGQLNLPNAVIGPGLLVVAFAALVLRASRAASAWKAIVAAGGSIPAVVMTRVVVDGLRDPTSHNLWPFEVVIAVVVGLTVAGTGVLIGMLVARLNPARGSD